MNLLLLPDANEPETIPFNQPDLVQTEPPPPSGRTGVPTHIFVTRRVPDRSTIEAQNRLLGKGGEELVLEHERKVLRDIGREDLANRIVHVSEAEGDGAGFDIHSFTSTGGSKFIEVKTTTGSIETPFFMSANEVAFAETKGEEFYLYRLYDYSPQNRRSAFYIISGNLADSFQLTPVQFRAVR